MLVHRLRRVAIQKNITSYVAVLTQPQIPRYSSSSIPQPPMPPKPPLPPMPPMPPSPSAMSTPNTPPTPFSTQYNDHLGTPIPPNAMNERPMGSESKSGPQGDQAQQMRPSSTPEPPLPPLQSANFPKINPFQYVALAEKWMGRYYAATKIIKFGGALVILTAAGALILYGVKNLQVYRELMMKKLEQWKEKASPIVGKLQTAKEIVKEKVEETNLKEKVNDAKENVKERVRESLDKNGVTERVYALTEKVQEGKGMEDVKERLSEMKAHVEEEMKEKLEEKKQRVLGYLGRQGEPRQESMQSSPIEGQLAANDKVLVVEDTQDTEGSSHPIREAVGGKLKSGLGRMKSVLQRGKEE